MLIQPVLGIPALRVEDSLVIGDLHIGVEAHLIKKGVHLTSRTDKMINSIMEAAGTEISRIVMIGDIKDSVPGSTKQEYREIPVFCDRLLDNFSEVCIVRGNHDTMIEDFVPRDVKIYPATGMTIGEVGLIHGHTWPSEEVMACKTLVMGHEHPTVLFKDGVGAHMSEPCWIRGKFRETTDERYSKLPENFIVVPAFNRLLGGSPMNVVGSNPLGPIMNSDLLDLDSAHFYLLDGVDLGRRENLMVKTTRFKKWNDDENSPRHKSL